MKTSHALFSICDLLLLALTAFVGLEVEGREGYARHILLGVLAALFTCFVHVVYYMYFVVQAKIFGEAIEHHGLNPMSAQRVLRQKSIAYRWSIGGILAMLLTSALGMAIDAGSPVQLHFAAAVTTLFIEAAVFYSQFALLGEYQALFHEVFAE